MSEPLRPAEEAGAWPFVTRRVYRAADGTELVWSSRHHRKGLVAGEARVAARMAALQHWLWMPRELNWWIGNIFAVGSVLFALGSVLSLAPALARAWSLDTTQINAIFFTGSIPFTVAAYLQLYQAANAGEFSPSGSGAPAQRRRLGWRPHDAGWSSCALQLLGTVLFNFNTFDAMIPSLTWFEEDLVVWAPNIAGSILFLASGYLAFIETCHGHWGWKPGEISWCVVFANLLGCIAFMISAVFAIVFPGGPNVEAATISLGFTLLGAIGFLAGSLLMLPEAHGSQIENPTAQADTLEQ